MRELFGIEIARPVYTAEQPHVLRKSSDLGGSRPLDLSTAGTGTLQVLRLPSSLYARPANVILLDETGSHQHAILQQPVCDMLRRVADDKGEQIIIATHSDTILNATPPDRVLGFFGGSPGCWLAQRNAIAFVKR